MTSREELEAAIEAILFVATEPVTAERLHGLFSEDERETVEAALQAVVARYPGSDAQGMVADFVSGGVRLVTRPALQGYLRKFFQVTGRTKLSMAALETLAIVAYRQPITAPEIQELRAVSSTGVLKTLLDHRLVRISGRKEVVGKPFLYCTSREFLIRFGLNRLQDLPPLEELEQMLASQADADGGSSAQQSLELRFDATDPGADLDLDDGDDADDEDANGSAPTSRRSDEVPATGSSGGEAMSAADETTAVAVAEREESVVREEAEPVKALEPVERTGSDDATELDEAMEPDGASSDDDDDDYDDNSDDEDDGLDADEDDEPSEED